MSRAANYSEALISWITLINFLKAKRQTPSPNITSILKIIQYGRKSLSLWASRYAVSRNISFPNTRVKRTALLWQQMFRRVYLDFDYLWWEPFRRVTYIWYQCDTKSRAISPKNIQEYSGIRAARMARKTALDARSQTISRTAPKRVDWLNFLAAMPSKASRV